MVKVFPEVSCGNLCAQVLVCRGNYAHVHLNVFVAADAGELFLLKHTQHLCLGGQGHVPDLVKKQGSAVCLLELSFVLLDGRSEGSFLVAEQLAFYELRRNGGAVYLYIRHCTTGALLV